MPNEQQYRQAVEHVLAELNPDYEVFELVDGVRNYFNENNIEYETFSNRDLEPFIAVSD